VVVVGAGAIGNELVKGLALIGVGQALVVDMDLIAPSNLTRSVLFRMADVGRPKAEVVCERASELNPDSRFVPVVGDIEWTVSDADMAAADVVIGCLDNAYARSVLNRRTRQVNRPWLDGGISIDAIQVSGFRRPGPCWACSVGERTLAQLRQRFSCTGFRRETAASPVPTTAVTASIAGAILLERTVGLLHGETSAIGVRDTLLLSSRVWSSATMTIRADCPLHGPTSRRHPRRMRTRSHDSMADLWDEVGASDAVKVRVPHELIVGMTCSACGYGTTLVAPRGRVGQEQGICDRCGSVTVPTLRTILTRTSPEASLPLATLGINDGDHLMIQDARRRTLVELDGDSLWSPTQEDTRWN